MRCLDIEPSNELGGFLADADGEPDYDFGAAAVSIDTSNGAIDVDGDDADVASVLVGDDESPPQVRVFAVGSLRTEGEVQVSGEHALAVVSDGEIRIGGDFIVQPDTGSFSDPSCRGGSGESDIDENFATRNAGGGGGGFGSPGAAGGDAEAFDGSTLEGGEGGDTSGNPALVPLRGGCAGDGSAIPRAEGGGAVQLVSRTGVVVDAVLAAPGQGGGNRGGGSGGGILLEAPEVVISGNVTANGGGGGCFGDDEGDDGRTDDSPASGGECDENNTGDGGDGAAANTGATEGADASTNAGSGGGGVGRIRINTVDDGFEDAGLFSPSPRTGDLELR